MKTSTVRFGAGALPLPKTLRHALPSNRRLICTPRVSTRPDPPKSSSEVVPEVTYKDLSPAAREAQENILALNGSRVRALQELKAANEKIAELEKKLEEAAKQISHLASRRTSDASEAAAPAAVEPSVNGHAPVLQPRSPPATITVLYVTGWEDVYLHLQVDDQPWTSLPGLKMEHGSGLHSNKMSITVPGERMKFVLTNGLGKFDTPNPYGDPNKPRNYEIDAPGTYLLQDGQVTKIDG